MEKPLLEYISLIKSAETQVFILDFVEQNGTIPNFDHFQEELNNLLKRGAVDCVNSQYSISPYGKLLLNNDELVSQYHDLKTNVQGMFLLHFLSRNRDIPNNETLTKEIQSLVDEKWILDNLTGGYYITESGKYARKKHEELKRDSKERAERNVRFQYAILRIAELEK